MLVFSATIANAQIDSIFYGIVYDTTPTIRLAKINPFTGEITNISPVTYPYWVSSEGSTIDPIHRIYYQADDSLLSAFDLTTGNLLYANRISNIPNSTFLGLNFNCPDSTLYGISRDTTNGNCKLSSIETVTAVVHAISADTIPEQISILYGDAINPYTSVYYYVSTNRKLVGVDMATGVVVSRPSVIISYGRFGPIVFDCQDSTIYGLAGDMTQGRKFAKIDPVTGTVTNISQNNVAMAIINSTPTLDPFNGIYYFLNSDYKITGIDIVTGEISSNPVMQEAPGTHFYNFLYNHPCYVSYPLGIPDPQAGYEAVSLYPNPVVDILYVGLKKISSGKIEVYAESGILLKSRNFTSQNSVSIDLSGFAQGLYILKVIQKDSIETRLVIKD